MTKHEVIEILRDIKNLKENKDIPFGLIEKYIMMIDDGAREQSGHLRNLDTTESTTPRKAANSRASEGDPYTF